MDKDERFKHISADPKFRHIPKGDRKVKIDKRFRGMFEDEKFKVKYTVDKRGRPVNHSSNNDLKRYYDISSDSEESDEETIGKFVRAPETDETGDITEHLDDKLVPDPIKKKLKDLTVDYARGEGCLNSDSSSDDEESEDESNESDVEHGWGELDRDAETTEESTRRLAMCNMDWDRIRAVDLMVLFNSFLSAGSHIESITIYPSEFGLQRMKEEDVNGPTELVKNNVKEKNIDTETEEGSKYHMEKLRQYQLNRLKYYYAVIVCDSIETANKIYTECDGLEYESSATKIDLRFIPDDTTFDQDPKEKCDKLPELSRYQPRFFTTTALQQAKVELTWDETNPNRVEIAQKLSDGKVDDVSEADLQAYLASSSGEESDDGQEEDNDKTNLNPLDKYRALLNDLEKSKDPKEKDLEMEVTWEINTKNNNEKLVKKKIAENEEKTPFQQFLDKRKDKRKQKREERKLKDGNDTENSDSDQDVDMNDPYFAEEFNNPEFKIKKNKKKEHSTETQHETQEKAQLELLLLDNDEKGHFNFKSIEKLETADKTNKKKRKKYKNKKEDDETKVTNDDFQVNVKDARFSAIFTSHHFNIDPTDARYRKTKAMEALIEEKQSRIDDDTRTKDAPPIKKPKHAELNALISSVKRKTDARYRKTKQIEPLVEEKQSRINDDTKNAPPNKKPKHAELNALISSVKRKTDARYRKNKTMKALIEEKL